MIKNLMMFTIFLLGLYFIFNNPLEEGFKETSDMPYQCPNILIQKGNTFLLYNSKLAKVPGVNPLTFNNLEDYTEFVDWQRSNDITCPILFLQESYDLQGKPVLKARSSPTNLQGGLPDKMVERTKAEQSKLLDAGRGKNAYNKNLYPGYDPKGQYIGLETPLDKMFNAPDNTISPNAMDTTWGGREYTDSVIEESDYKQR